MHHIKSIKEIFYLLPVYLTQIKMPKIASSDVILMVSNFRLYYKRKEKLVISVTRLETYLILMS